MPYEQERDALTFGHTEIGYRGQVLPARLDRCMKIQRIRTRNGRKHALQLPHPWNHQTVVEADHELHVHGHLPANALHNADHIWCALAGRHAVDDPHRTVFRFELSFQNEGARPIAPANSPYVADRAEYPPPMPLMTQKGREAGAGIKAGQAQPVD